MGCNYTLGEIADINVDQYSLKEKWPHVQYLDTGNVKKGRIGSLQQLNPMKDELPGRARRKVRNGSIVYSMVRPDQEHYALLDNPPSDMLVSTGFAVIDANEDIVLPRYLYYTLTHVDTIAYFQALAEQSVSTYPTLSKSDLADLTVSVPSIETQRATVSILASLDSKIELNNRTNDYLAAMLMFKFTHWLETREAERGCLQSSRLGDLDVTITDYVANGSFASLKQNVELLNNDGYAYFMRNTDLKSGKFNVFVSKHSYDFLSKSALFGREIIISNVGDVGSVYRCPILDKPMTLGNNEIMIKGTLGGININNYLYLFFSSRYGQYLIDSVTGGSVQRKFNKTDFRSIKIPVPSASELEAFNTWVTPFFAQMDINSREDNYLTNLRDILLPKLISGEIDVSQVEIQSFTEQVGVTSGA